LGFVKYIDENMFDYLVSRYFSDLSKFVCLYAIFIVLHW